MKILRFKEKLYKWIFTILAFASLFFLVGIVLVLVKGYIDFILSDEGQKLVEEEGFVGLKEKK